MYMGPGTLNSGPETCSANILTTEISPSPFSSLFTNVAISSEFGYCAYEEVREHSLGVSSLLPPYVLGKFNLIIRLAWQALLPAQTLLSVYFGFLALG